MSSSPRFGSLWYFFPFFKSGVKFLKCKFILKFPFEFLRVYSPSAEVRGHGVGQEILQVGKKEVGIAQLKQVGLYAIQPVFSDGHESGIFSWQYLLWMGENQSSLWQDYLDRIKSAGASREPDVQDKVVVAQKKGACSGH